MYFFSLDASNPDLAPHFSAGLSRNFAPDIESVDGACEVASCLDPIGTDDNGHGTHVAGTIGAAANGIGVSGVAPNVTLVELKGGQDSGYFFLNPVVNALTHAANSGLDVVNMSFFVDPWLYNCVANPADSAQEQAEQRAIIRAMWRALTYAHARGVTLVAGHHGGGHVAVLCAGGGVEDAVAGEQGAGAAAHPPPTGERDVRGRGLAQHLAVQLEHRVAGHDDRVRGHRPGGDRGRHRWSLTCPRRPATRSTAGPGPAACS